MKYTYGEVFAQLDSIIEKKAFIPAPGSSAGQDMMGQAQGGQGQQPQAPPGDDGGGQGQMGGQGIEDPSTGVEPGPPSQGMDPSQGGDPSQGDPSQQGQDPGQDQGQAAKGVDGRGDAAPTDLDSTTVTLRLRDVLDLVSGGKATQSALKIQDLLNKQQLKNEQMSRQQAMKEQQQQQQAQMQQQQGMQGGGQGGMMDQSGIYGNPALGGQPPQQ